MYFFCRSIFGTGNSQQPLTYSCNVGDGAIHAKHIPTGKEKCQEDLFLFKSLWTFIPLALLDSVADPGGGGWAPGLSPWEKIQ